MDSSPINKLLIVWNLDTTKQWWRALICHVGLCLEDPAGGPKQTWKGIAALPSYHTFKPPRLSSPGPHKTATLCAQSPTHQNTELFSGILKELKWLSSLCCDCARRRLLSHCRLWEWTLGTARENINCPSIAWQDTSWVDAVWIWIMHKWTFWGWSRIIQPLTESEDR